MVEYTGAIFLHPENILVGEAKTDVQDIHTGTKSGGICHQPRHVVVASRAKKGALS